MIKKWEHKVQEQIQPSSYNVADFKFRRLNRCNSYPQKFESVKSNSWYVNAARPCKDFFFFSSFNDTIKRVARIPLSLKTVLHSHALGHPYSSPF